MTLGEKLNNPLNIRYNQHNHWQGQVGQNGGFVNFANYIWGLRAAAVILKQYRKRGIVTVEKIISTWAPASENDTESYIKYVCRRTGMTRLMVVDSVPLVKGLICAMIEMETGMKISSETVSNIVKAVGI